MKGSSLRWLLVLGSLAACRPAGGSPSGVELPDDAGERLRLAAPPHRIVSLNPSTTELSLDLGAGPRLVGRSDACDYPADAATEIPALARRPEWRVLSAVRGGRLLPLTESSANRPSPRAPAAIRSLSARLAATRSLSARLAALTVASNSGESR